jgi:hypothetical protein
VNSIPALREKKRVIDVHTNIATALLNQIKSRELDTYFQYEEAILTKTFLVCVSFTFPDLQKDKKDLQTVLNNEKIGTIDDKLRLFLIFFMCTENIASADLDSCKEALLRIGADLSAFEYVKK